MKTKRDTLIESYNAKVMDGDIDLSLCLETLLDIRDEIIRTKNEVAAGLILVLLVLVIIALLVGA